MRDDSTVRLNAAAPDDRSSRTTAMETATLRRAPVTSDDDSGAASGTGAAEDRPGGDRGTEATTRVAPRAAEEGHMPGPGLPIPPAARERRERPRPPEDRPVMPGRPPPSSGPPAPPVAAPSAHPPGPPRPAGPRPTGPGRPSAAPASAAPRTTAGRSRARTTPPASRATASPLRQRVGGIAAGVALGLVAIVAASWTLLVPPDGRDTSDGQISAPQAEPAAPAVRWVRTDGDEFDGRALDRARWNVYDSVGGFGNGLRRPSAVTQDDGLLTITARPRLDGGTSGGISMSDGQLHGRWEFRARADAGNGYSPAVLLWPDSERFPADGELDMLESPNGNRSTANAFVHYGADNRTRGAQVPVDLTQWHTFAFEWLPDRITWYVDGRKSWEITDRSVFPTKPMHLCIQLDQGPAVKFLPGPDASTPDEVRMQVDWARQYRVG